MTELADRERRIRPTFVDNAVRHLRALHLIVLQHV